MKMATDLDIIVGSRIRMARSTRGFSRPKVADALGLSEQQLWKYEKGTNRIPASRLWELAQLLEFPLAWFFSETEEQAQASKHLEGVSAKALEFGHLIAKMPRKQRMIAYTMIEALILHGDSEVEPEAELTEEEGEPADA